MVVMTLDCPNWTLAPLFARSLVMGLGQLDQMLQRTTESIELRDDELVALPRDQQSLIQPGASGQLARCLVDEDLIATGCGQRIVLSLGVLVSGGHPGHADPHGRTVSRTPKNVT